MSKARGLADLGNAYSDGALSNRNLIINGSMVHDQRNSGGAVNNANSYTLDRWYFMQGQASTTVAHNVQQSSTAPSSFSNSLKITVATAANPSTSNYTALFHRVEGYNCSQLNYGQSTASTSTLSFWVNSSVTGTFGVSFQNSASTRSYVGTYTINVANTWEHKTITIQGDTSGTWLSDSGLGLSIYWDIGVGTAQSTTAGTWQSANMLGLTGGTKLSQTAGATLQITGVQLEVGDTATPFEHRSYGQELALCQRYLTMFKVLGAGERILIGAVEGATKSRHDMPLATPMRATPTITTNGTLGVYEGGVNRGFTSPQITSLNNSLAGLSVAITSGVATAACMIRFNSTSDYISLDAEL